MDAAKSRRPAKDVSWLVDLKIRQTAIILVDQCFTPVDQDVYQTLEDGGINHRSESATLSRALIAVEMWQCVYDGLQVWADMYEVAQKLAVIIRTPETRHSSHHRPTESETQAQKRKLGLSN